MTPEPSSTDHSNSGQENEAQESAKTAHLDGVADGCGCTEVWEHLSEQREEQGE